PNILRRSGGFDLVLRHPHERLLPSRVGEPPDPLLPEHLADVLDGIGTVQWRTRTWHASCGTESCESRLSVSGGTGTSMSLSVGLEPRAEIHMAPTPALVAFAHLLGLPGLELDRTIAAQLAANPALVGDEVGTCDRCGMPSGGACPLCDRSMRRHDDAGFPASESRIANTEPPSPVSWVDELARELMLHLPDRCTPVV